VASADDCDSFGPMPKQGEGGGQHLPAEQQGEVKQTSGKKAWPGCRGKNAIAWKCALALVGGLARKRNAATALTLAAAAQAWMQIAKSDAGAVVVARARPARLRAAFLRLQLRYSCGWKRMHCLASAGRV